MTEQNNLVRCRCDFCGELFWSKRKTANYCTPSHKQKMYRWRTKLDRNRVLALQQVTTIGSYLTFENSTPSALKALNEVISECFRQMDSHNVKRVK